MLKASQSMMTTHWLQSGFTLLEILITLIILSVGLLGLAGLQTMSLRNNHSAYLGSQAAIQSYDIADRMRANSVEANATPTSAYAKSGAAIAGIQVADCDKVAGCSAANMALHDLYEWNLANKSMLPQGVGIVCRDSTMDDGSYDYATNDVTTGCTNTGTDPLVVKIWWIDNRSGDPVASRFSMVIGDQL